MRAKIVKTIFENGQCTVEIRSPRHQQEHSVGHYLVDDSEAIDQSELTPVVLRMISEAYEAGYADSVEDCTSSLRKQYERFPVGGKRNKVAAKIGETVDYRRAAAPNAR